jgi:hypothetical protein
LGVSRLPRQTGRAIHSNLFFRASKKGFPLLSLTRARCLITSQSFKYDLLKIGIFFDENFFMKKNILLFFVGLLSVSALLMSFSAVKNEPVKYEFTSFTIIESIVPNGLGRSRLLHAKESRNYLDYTKEMSDEDDSRNKSERSEIRVKNYDETKLLNFYNMGGIRMQNICANDAVINSKVNAMLDEGWELVNIVSGVESKGSQDDTDGIFITRMYFKKIKQ